MNNYHLFIESEFVDVYNSVTAGRCDELTIPLGRNVSPKIIPAFFCLSYATYANRFTAILSRMQHLFAKTLLLISLAFGATSSFAAENSASDHVWHGEWQAEGMPFSLRVIPAGERFTVLPLEPAAIEWQARNGVISGNTGTIDIEYQGVTAQVLVQLQDTVSAIVRPMSCQPDYHVICTLVRNQQARFIKRSPD